MNFFVMKGCMIFLSSCQEVAQFLFCAKKMHNFSLLRGCVILCVPRGYVLCEERLHSFLFVLRDSVILPRGCMLFFVPEVG